MIRFHLFRALQPAARYPVSPLDLSFNGVRYDLTLPPRVGIAFAHLLSSGGPFHRLSQYCNVTGFDALRTGPDSFRSGRPLGAYAEFESCVESTAQGVPIGFVAQFAAADAAAARKILRSAIDGKTFTFDVVDWIFGHAPFLDYAGGFEIAHVCSYASTDEREFALDAAAGFFDDAEPNPHRPHVTRLTVWSSSPAKENCP